MRRREFLARVAGVGASSLGTSLRAHSKVPPAPYPATNRTPVAADYERLRFGVSYHFSMNTFTGNDYETGTAPATAYNPRQLDVRQWLEVARDMGARYAVLTAKHMSGFCLWDSEDYDYDVAASGNKTDVVAAFVAACYEYGLRPGFYYCILDPHNEGRFDWNSPVGDRYYKIIRQHLTELHSRYRNIFYQLLDITWKLSANQRWELYRLIKSFSRNCLVVMNQGFYQSRRNRGRIAEAASWPTDVINAEDNLPPEGGHNPRVHFQGKTYYLPMEAWIPTGPPYKPMPPMHSWFWREGFKTQSAETIAGMYRHCMRGNSNLLLNLSP
ncbi:MAG: alpha-L-fucosidase, partial [Acidobacteria bacterium]|nr:alpha-L-fucosidase [Acidobacteriota bacterium]